MQQVSRQAGFSLLESAIGLVVAGLLLGAVATAIVKLQGAVVEGTMSAGTDETTRLVFERLVEELREADLDSVVIGAGGSSITFSTVEGWNGSAPQLSAPRTIALTGDQVAVDGIVLAAGVTVLDFQLNGSLLTMLLEVRDQATIGGTSRVVSRQLTAKLKL